jgi:hypothetical protein
VVIAAKLFCRNHGQVTPWWGSWQVLRQCWQPARAKPSAPPNWASPFAPSGERSRECGPACGAIPAPILPGARWPFGISIWTPWPLRTRWGVYGMIRETGRLTDDPRFNRRFLRHNEDLATQRYGRFAKTSGSITTPCETIERVTRAHVNPAIDNRGRSEGIFVEIVDGENFPLRGCP